VALSPWGNSLKRSRSNHERHAIVALICRGPAEIYSAG
jgi:hypothetical protein